MRRGWPSAVVAAFFVLIGCMACGTRPVHGETWLGQAVPGTWPVVFMEGVVSSERFEHGPVAIASDCSEIYWGSHFEHEQPLGRILFIRRKGDAWTAPSIAPFIRGYSSGEPFFMGADLLLFRSDRPLGSAGLDRCLWVTRRTPAGWSEPEPLGDVFRGVSFQASMTAAGTVYFCTDAGAGRRTLGKSDICRAVFRDGTYALPENLGPPVNTGEHDWSPFITPDERMLLFASTRAGGRGRSDLYVSFHRRDGGWTDPVNLGRPINTGDDEDWPSLSPDGRFLFFVRKGDVRWVEAGILAKLEQRARR